jgi:hypothetical protein
MLACWGVAGSAAGSCGSPLARAGWSSTCRLLGRRAGGPGVLQPLLLLLPGLGSGQRELGSTRAPSRGRATGLQRAGTVHHSEVWFDLIFCCQCSTKCLQELKIRIFQICHFGCSSYWIRYPGIFLFWRKNEFCKNLYFKFDMVSVSDSNFGSSLCCVPV